MYSKSIKTEAIFTKTEMNNEWKINFLQNSPLGMQHIFPAVSFLLKASNFTLEIHFQFRKQRFPIIINDCN